MLLVVAAAAAAYFVVVVSFLLSHIVPFCSFLFQYFYSQSLNNDFSIYSNNSDSEFYSFLFSSIVLFTDMIAL